MRQVLTVLFLAMFSTTLSGQQYMFSPRYKVSIRHNVYDRIPKLSFNVIDTFTRGSFIVDMDAKTISNPDNIGNEPDIIPIKEIIRDDINHAIILKTKYRDDVSFEQYKLQFSDKGTLLLIQESYRYKGFERTDTIYNTYFNNPTVIAFYEQSNQVKLDTAMRADIETFVKKRDSVYYQRYAATATNAVRLHRGRIYWTEGSGKTAIRHDSLFVFKSSILPDKSGVVLDCYEEVPGTETKHYQFTYWYGKLFGTALSHYITIVRGVKDAGGKDIFTGFWLLL